MDLFLKPHWVDVSLLASSLRVDNLAGLFLLTNQNDCLRRAFHFLPVCSQGQGKLVSGVSFELKLAELFISFKPYTDAFELSLCWRAFFFFVVSAHHFLPSHCFEQVL